MRIVIDARSFKTGIGRYTEQLLEQLQQIDRQNEYIVLLLPHDFDRWNPRTANFTKHKANVKIYSFAEQLLLPFVLYRLRPDVVHFTNFNVPLAYLGRYVVTLHDLTYRTHWNRRGGWRGAGYAIKHWAMLLDVRRATSAARLILVPSKFVGDEVAKFYPKAAQKLVVTYESAESAQVAPAEQPVVPPPFLLYSGTYYVHKNVNRLLDAFARIAPKRPTLKLVLSGLADGFYLKTKQLVASMGLADRVVMPGFVSRAELERLYADADLFVFPSLSEGFGLTGLEAMARGTPVVAADNGCLPEIYGHAAIFFNPTDPEEMALTIERVLDDQELRQQLTARGFEQVKLYSWRKMATQTLTAYTKSAK